MPSSEPSPELVMSSNIGIMSRSIVILVDGETIKQSGTTGALQVLLTTSARRVGRIPRLRTFPLARAIVMADLSAALAARCPVTAREIFSSVERRTIWPRPGEYVVDVGRVARAV